MLVTVAICTWNRADLLHQTLAEMHKLHIPVGVEWELLVVNNNCTDDTDRVIQSHAGHLPVRRLFESTQGLSNARNCAVAAANGELLIWTDDDVLVDPRWLQEYVEAAKRWPLAAAFGGKVLPWFETDPPRWLAENLSLIGSYFALRDLGDAEATLDGAMPYGANMAFRTRVLKEYPFDTTLGRVGDTLIGGDDVKVLQAIHAAGYQVVWVPGAVVRHFLPRSRMTLQYIGKLVYCAGRYETSVDGCQPGHCIFGVPRWLIRKWVTAEVRFFFSRMVSSQNSRSWLRRFARATALRGHVQAYRAANAKRNTA